MPFNDLRGYIDKLKGYGELIEIDKEVDWNLEIGAIVRRCCEIGTPAVHAKNIKGYSSEHSILGAPCAGSTKGPHARVSISMGLEPDIEFPALLDEFLKRTGNPIKPVVVKDGICKENIMLGKDVDVFQFPAPMVHDGDGGRYIATFHGVVTKDPDSEWVNWGMYRAMIQRKNRLGGLLVPNQHIGMLHQKYEAMQQPMPFAMFFGGDIQCSVAAATMYPVGITEADMVGALNGKPLEMVKCETNDLYVPATSEIVFEGEVIHGLRWDEGPFGEYTGYRASPRMPRPVYHINCITYRNNPIMPMSCMGVPIDDCAAIHSLATTAEIQADLMKKGWPIKGVYVPPECITFLAIVSTKVPYTNFASQVATEVWNTKGGLFCPYVIVVEDDVDPTNLMQVMHALVTKCHPVRGIQKIDHAPASPLTCFLNLRERQFALGSNVYFDCTWPKDWDPSIAVPPKSAFHSIYPKEIQEKVLKRWVDDYGFHRDSL